MPQIILQDLKKELATYERYLNTEKKAEKDGYLGQSTIEEYTQYIARLKKQIAAIENPSSVYASSLPLFSLTKMKESALNLLNNAVALLPKNKI